MPDEPLFLYKYLRLGDALFGNEIDSLLIAPLNRKAAGESARATFHEPGAGASLSVRFTAWWQRGYWVVDERLNEFAGRIRKDMVKFAAATQMVVNQRSRKGPLCRVAKQITHRAQTTTAATGTGSETVTIDKDIEHVAGSKILVISATDGQTHDVITVTGATSTTITATFGRAYPIGSVIYLVEWYVPGMWPTVGPVFVRDDGSADSVVKTDLVFEGSDDPVDNFGVKGPPVP